jgi:hypothetical protein
MKYKRGNYITAAEDCQLLDGVDAQVEKETSGASAGNLVVWFSTRIAPGIFEVEEQRHIRSRGKKGSAQEWHPMQEVSKAIFEVEDAELIEGEIEHK